MNCLLARVLGVFVLAVCGWGATAWGEDNLLSAEEKREGWVLLFDGKTTDGWMSIHGQPLDGRHVQEGSLNPHPCDYMLVYGQPQSDFRLKVDFKIAPRCNSGLFVRTSPLEARPGKDVGYNGLEIAIDDTQTADWHDTGALYDLVKPRINAMRPVGSWNQLEVQCDDERIDVTVNGELVTRMNLDEWTEAFRRPDGSTHKFDIAYQNHPRRGYIGLQDHGSDCWYKNIKLLPLK